MRPLLFFVFVFFYTLNAQEVFVLCEGNFQTPNASVWRFNPANQDNPAQRWNWYYNASEPNGGNPLGDTGQHLSLFDDEMFVVCNNSHNIEYVKFINDEPVHVESIILSGSSPRQVMAHEDILYVASWGVSGILVLEKETFGVIDTISLPAVPEDMVLDGNTLYVSMIQDLTWNKYDGVAKIDLISREMVHEYKVVRGANKMVLADSLLYVTGTWFDESWNALTGTSVINVSTGDVSTREYGMTPNFSENILAADQGIFRLFRKDIYPVEQDGSLGSEPILTDIAGSLETVYSISWIDGRWYAGITDDYMAPDYVRIFENNIQIAEFTVGPLPRNFVSYNPIYASTQDYENIYLKKEFNIIAGPNPFNSRTKIHCYLPETGGIISGFISNIQGKIVHTFTETEISQGNAEFYWEATRESSGLYIASFIFRSDRQTYHQNSKLILIK